MKRKLTILLAAIILVQMLPMAAFWAQAANWKGSDFGTGTFATRLDGIISNGITKNVSPSFPAVNGRFSSSQCYQIKFPNRRWSGWQCIAYAYAAYNELFQADPYQTGTVLSAFQKQSSLSYEQLKNVGLRPGAYLRTTANRNGSFNAANGHSLLILSYDSGKIVTLEANSCGGGQYKVEILSRNWSDFNRANFSGRYVCNLVQPGYNAAGVQPCAVHTQGTYRTFEANHPHHSIYICAVCGAQYADKNTQQYYEKCEQCNPPTCTVTFDPNGGSVSQTSKQVKKGELIGSVPVPVRAGYTFVTWSFEKAPTGTFLGVGNNSVYITEDVTLYAYWRQDPKPTPTPEPEPDPTPAPEPEPTFEPTPEPTWGEWSQWQDEAVSASSTRQVETRRVVDTPAHTEYRYGRWVNSESFDHFCPEAAVNSGHRNDFHLDYTAWSPNRLIQYESKWFCTDRTHNHQHCSARNQTYNGKTGDVWHGYKTSPNAVEDYYWEETRAVPATYKTQYRYRDLEY